MRVDTLLAILQAISDDGSGEDEITDDYQLDEHDSDAGAGLIAVIHCPASSVVRLEFDQ